MNGRDILKNYIKVRKINDIKKMARITLLILAISKLQPI